MAKGRTLISPERIEMYDRRIAEHELVERKGATIPYTSVNGHMFSCMNKKGEVGLRLPTDDREAFLKKHKTTMFTSYGVVMKEYVTVPESILKSKTKFQRYFDQSLEYVSALKPKPTTRKKANGS